MSKKYPVTIDNRWDILYSEYPEKYDEFASIGWPRNEEDQIHNVFDLTGLQVLDVGSGTGKSTFQISPYAGFVIGLEPEKAMRDLAIAEAGSEECKVR